MRWNAMLLTTSALILATATLPAEAQQGPGGPMMRQGQGPMMQQGPGPMMQQDRGSGAAQEQASRQDTTRDSRGYRYDDDDDDCDNGHHHHHRWSRGSPGWGGRAMMGREFGPRGAGMMGFGMGPGMMRMAVILMDADGDGALSLEEFRAGHERIFRGLDANKDGRLTTEEMQAFMHRGARAPAQQQPQQQQQQQ